MSHGAVPHLDRVVILSDGKAPTCKGGPNFGMAIGMRKMFELKEVVLCFGQTAHMDGTQDSAGKQPHEILSIYSSQDMYNFCVKNMAHPSWIVKGQPAPPGAFGDNSAYIWGFYNNGSNTVTRSEV